MDVLVRALVGLTPNRAAVRGGCWRDEDWRKRETIWRREAAGGEG